MYVCVFSIDASAETAKLGRLVNDSLKFSNSKMEKIVIGNTPHLCLFATRDIECGEEILYFYGLKDQPWYPEVVSTLLFFVLLLNRIDLIIF